MSEKSEIKEDSVEQKLFSEFSFGEKSKSPRPDSEPVRKTTTKRVTFHHYSECSSHNEDIVSIGDSSADDGGDEISGEVSDRSGQKVNSTRCKHQHHELCARTIRMGK